MGGRGSIKLIDPSTGVVMQSYTEGYAKPRVVRDLAGSSDGTQFLTICDHKGRERQVHLWSRTGGPPRSVSGAASQARSIAFSRQGGEFGIGYKSGHIARHDARTRDHLPSAEGSGENAHPCKIRALLYTSDDRYLLSVNSDSNYRWHMYLRVWDTRTNEVVNHMTGRSDILSLDLSLDGKRLLVVRRPEDAPRRIEVWSTEQLFPD